MAEGDIEAGRQASLFAELAPPVALIGLSIYLWTLADAFTGGAQRYEAIGPDFFPKLLLTLLVALCLWQIAAVALRRYRTPAARECKPRVYWADLAIAVGITATYVALLSPVGFLLSTPLFQAALLVLVFRVRSMLVLAIAPLALTGGLLLLFVGVMNAPLPRGRWLFFEFSRLFY